MLASGIARQDIPELGKYAVEALNLPLELFLARASRCVTSPKFVSLDLS
jgi:hypothetical protein